jgi:peroxiredoxin
MALRRHNTLRKVLISGIQKEFPYPLLSDPDRVLIAALGAKDASGKTKRGHFIFAKGGKLVDKKLPVSPGDRYVVVSSHTLTI